MIGLVTVGYSVSNFFIDRKALDFYINSNFLYVFWCPQLHAQGNL